MQSVVDESVCDNNAGTSEGALGMYGELPRGRHMCVSVVHPFARFPDFQAALAVSGGDRAVVTEVHQPGGEVAVLAINDVPEQQSYKEAMSSSYARQWLEGIHSEFQSHIAICVWDVELMDLPPESTVVKCKWVFKVKPDFTGAVARFKATMVAKGCSQRAGWNTRRHSHI